MHARLSHLSVDGDGVNAMVLAGSDDTPRDLAAVGDQHFGRRVLE
jgi:hypothetical protein